MTTLLWIGLLAGQSAWATPTVSATGTATASNLDLDGEGSSGTHIVKVADVSLSTDNPSGCTLTISSGGLVKVGGLDISYQVTSVADSASPPVQGDFTVPSGNDYTFAIASATSANRDVYVLYSTRNLQDPGTYGETLFFSVTDH